MIYRLKTSMLYYNDKENAFFCRECKGKEFKFESARKFENGKETEIRFDLQYIICKSCGVYCVVGSLLNKSDSNLIE